MPKFRIVTDVRLSRTYEIEAASEEAALQQLEENAPDPIGENEWDECVDEVEEIISEQGACTTA
jgi:hypothetical protein